MKVYHLRNLTKNGAWAIVIAHNSSEARHLAGWQRSETEATCVGEYTGSRQRPWVVAQHNEETK